MSAAAACISKVGFGESAVLLLPEHAAPLPG